MESKAINFSDLHVSLKTGPNAYKTPAEVFWGQVNKQGDCWVWKGAIFPNGYGRFNLRGRHLLAHRIAALLSRKVVDFTDEKPVIRHHCDNRQCVNPEHLEEGTQKENMGDMVRRGRCNPAKGESSGKSKLTWESVFDIRLRKQSGETQKQLAKEYEVSQKQISIIVNNGQWRFDADDFQTLCLETCIYKAFSKNAIYPSLGLANEVGEAIGKLKKAERGDFTLTDDKIQQICDELGDVLFYVAVLGFELGIPMSDMMDSVINKLASRKERGKLQGDGDDR